MVIFFGPPGAGKSVQGQLLAARHGWRWLSTGQLLRDAKSLELQEIMTRGDFVSDKKINDVIDQALSLADSIDDVVLDGYPRKIEQAQWLLDNLPRHNRKITIVIFLNVSNEVIFQRLRIRGRADDSEGSIAKRSEEYSEKTEPVMEYLSAKGIDVLKVDGEGSVGTVHDRVEKALQSCIQK